MNSIDNYNKRNKPETSNIIKECQLLEKILSRNRLWGNLIPEKSWNANLRAILTKKEWEILRETVIKKNGNKCIICNAKNVKLEAHEEWKYIYERSIQKLVSITPLCKMCHLNQHLGIAFQILNNEDELNKLIDHWCKVNNDSNVNFKEYAKKVLSLWDLRNKFNWQVVDLNGNEISKGIDFPNLIKSIVNL